MIKPSSWSCSASNSVGEPSIGEIALAVFGKAITSRMESLPVISATRRSRPAAMPACGGAPYSKARSKKPNIFSARGDKIVIEGQPADIEKTLRVLNDLVTRIKQGETITEQYVNYAIGMVQENGIGPADSITTESLLSSSLKKNIKPKTIGQKEYVELVDKNDIVFAIGPAGTGKTYLAVAMALAELKAKKVERIVFTRPAVEAGESLGFLPGDVRAKVDPYLRPVYDALHDMMHPDKIKKLLEIGFSDFSWTLIRASHML